MPRSFVRRAVLFATLSTVFAALASACSASVPGDELGTFKVAGKLAQNTCGTGPGAPDPWSFYVQLSKDDKTLYWSWMDGTPPASGAKTDATHATIHGNALQSVGGADGGPAACSLARTDEVSVTLSAADKPSTFEGTITYSFAVQSGSCAAALTQGGGTYDALPCTISYTLSGSRK